jgi:hypothetical protein
MGIASMDSAARSSDASRTGIFIFRFGSMTACFANGRPRAAVRASKLLDSRATILPGRSRPSCTCHMSIG